MKLGERMDVASLAIKGDTSKEAGIELVEQIVKVLGMHKAHDPICYDYPVNNTGGQGYTYIQPITESFIAFDSWPDFKGAYLIICSCKTVNLNKVNKKIRKLGYKIKQVKANELTLLCRRV